jgi:hypothetical protein
VNSARGNNRAEDSTSDLPSAKTTRAADKGNEQQRHQPGAEMKKRDFATTKIRSGAHRSRAGKDSLQRWRKSENEPNLDTPDHGQNEDRCKSRSRNRLSGGSSLNRREENSQREQRRNLSTKPKAEICKHELKDTFSDLQDK